MTGNERPTVAARVIIDALGRAMRGESADPDPALAPFERMFFPLLADTAALVRFARDEVAGLVALSGAPSETVRHLALFALGFSGDPAAVDPLLDRLVDQRDFFDHDYCYVSIGRLGSAAFDRLYETATGADPDRAQQAIWALGKSRADSLPVFRRLLALPDPPTCAYQALVNTHDPRALPDIEPGLWHADPQVRSETLFTAWDLLEAARERAPHALAAIDVEKWGDRMVELYGDPELPEGVVAAYAIGLLGDGRQLPLLHAAFERLLGEDDEGAAIRMVESIGLLGTPEAHDWLVARRDHPRAGVAARVAEALGAID